MGADGRSEVVGVAGAAHGTSSISGSQSCQVPVLTKENIRNKMGSIFTVLYRVTPVMLRTK